MPWTATSEYELVTNINKFPLLFPSTIHVSENTKAFIKGCLQEEESDRMIINSLRIEIHTQNIDLEKLFNKMKLTQTSSLNKP
jgi:hypothetical protein